MPDLDAIEKEIMSALSGDIQKNALIFAAYLKANNMLYDGHEVSYNGKEVCFMHIGGTEKPICKRAYRRIRTEPPTFFACRIDDRRILCYSTIIM